MKLKLAKRIARLQHFKWIAVDSDSTLCGYIKEPSFCEYQGIWKLYGLALPRHYKILGHYTGNKHWSQTLRKIE